MEYALILREIKNRKKEIERKGSSFSMYDQNLNDLLLSKNVEQFLERYYFILESKKNVINIEALNNREINNKFSLDELFYFAVDVVLDHADCFLSEMKGD
jgi:hypothetical protein